MNFKGLIILVCSLLVVACSDSVEQLNEDYGPAQTRQRQLSVEQELAKQYREQVLPVLEKRCVVCHGCYDAPCQLKLSSPEGIDRGASKALVYDGARLRAADPTRLFIDAHTTEEWRNKGFSAVLNERDQTLLANLEGSIMYQLLLHKEQNPQPQGILPEQFNYSLSRQDQCPNLEELDDFKADNPLYGMPWGMPNLSNEEFKTLETWIGRGAPMSEPLPISKALQEQVAYWEKKLNGDSAKEQLIARYIYEHLFLGDLYFDVEPISPAQPPRFFEIVRSATPPGQPIEIIPTLRPYEDPKVQRVYYRLMLQVGTTLAKTNMPYLLDKKREKLWDDIFFQADFNVDKVPDYSDPNPFIVFQAIPVYARYQFLLEEAHFTISGFIKGPVCRGQIALNVINDKFWVFFTPPYTSKHAPVDEFLYQQAENLRLPAESSSETLSVSEWRAYSKASTRYIKAKSDYIDRFMTEYKMEGLSLNNIWSGNENAGLTVFRHFDSATVKQGLLGKQPKTAWVIDYPILERIHYLLVAGFDVYGNVGHQLTTRLYMDFLRIESEANFVSFLPNEDREPTLTSWYEGAVKELKTYLNDDNLMHARASSIEFTTEHHKAELLAMLKQHAYNTPELKAKQYQYAIPEQDLLLKRLTDMDNPVVQSLPEVSFIIIEDKKAGDRVYSLLRHNAHKNIASLLLESKNRLPKQDKSEIFSGFIGTYPGLIFKVDVLDKAEFVNMFVQATDAQKFQALITRFGVRRSNPDFWKVSDHLHQLYREHDPVQYGLLDYNRLVNK